jgi:hypothetical protein
MFGILAIVASVILVAIAVVVWIVWYDFNIGLGAPSRPDFSGYTTPSQLNGNNLESAQLVRYKEFGLDYWWFDYVLHYVPDTISVYERSATSYFRDIPPCQGKTSNMNPDYQYKCDEYQIKNGGHFIILTDKYKGELRGIRIEALKDNTEFYVRIPEQLAKNYVSPQVWQSYFDSLNAVNLQNMPFTHKTHHQGGA